MQALNNAPGGVVGGTAIAAIVLGTLGTLGAYAIKPIATSISPLSTGFTCALMPVVIIIGAVAFLDSNKNLPAFVGTVALVYPISVITAKCLMMNVSLIHPAIALISGGVMVGVFAVSALCVSSILGISVLGKSGG